MSNQDYQHWPESRIEEKEEEEEEDEKEEEGKKKEGVYHCSNTVSVLTCL